MTASRSIAELVEAPVDWLAEIPDPRTQVIARFVVDEPAPIDLLTRLVGDTADIQIVNGPVEPSPMGRQQGKQRALRDAFLDQVHDFFCSETRYSEERQRLLRDYRVGETSFVAYVTAAISPYVGGSANFVVAGVAVVLTTAGKMGINAWCATQKARRCAGQDAYDR